MTGPGSASCLQHGWGREIPTQTAPGEALTTRHRTGVQFPPSPHRGPATALHPVLGSQNSPPASAGGEFCASRGREAPAGTSLPLRDTPTSGAEDFRLLGRKLLFGEDPLLLQRPELLELFERFVGYAAGGRRRGRRLLVDRLLVFLRRRLLLAHLRVVGLLLLGRGRGVLLGKLVGLAA